MNRVFDFISFVLTISYSLVFFQLLHTFLPLRKSSFLRVPAFLACEVLSTMIIYSGDLDNLLGTLLGFALYLIIFHSGSWREKLSCLLVFYPSLIAVNYLVEDIGKRFFSIPPALLWVQALDGRKSRYCSMPLFMRCPFCYGFCSGLWHGSF